MQLEQYFVRLTSLALFNKVENLVQQSLYGDWIIRLQYGEQLSDNTIRWRQWKSPFFALKEASALNKAMLECRMCFPVHPIRLYAEKAHPEVYFIYWLYSPGQQPAVKTITEPEQAPAPLDVAYQNIST